MALEERKLDLGLEVAARRRAEPDVPELVAGHAVPAAVKPRTHREYAAILRMQLLQRVVDAHRTVEVLGIEPTRDVQDGEIGRNGPEILEDVLRLPVLIVVRMPHEV